jgi:hypothetical protein
MHASPFLLHRRALLAHSTLTRAERDALDAAVAPLAALPESQWDTVGAVRLRSPEALYWLRVDDSLRALVRPVRGDQPELLDLVRHEALERFFNGVG